MKSIESRIEKIEKDLSSEDKTQWLGIPDSDRPGEFIEITGYHNLAELVIALAKHKRAESEKEDTYGNRNQQ